MCSHLSRSGVGWPGAPGFAPQPDRRRLRCPLAPLLLCPRDAHLDIDGQFPEMRGKRAREGRFDASLAVAEPRDAPDPRLAGRVALFPAKHARSREDGRPPCSGGNQVRRVSRHAGARTDVAARLEIGEKGGARDAWAETRFRSGTGITSVVPWHAPSPGGWPSTLLGLPQSRSRRLAAAARSFRTPGWSGDRFPLRRSTASSTAGNSLAACELSDSQARLPPNTGIALASP